MAGTVIVSNESLVDAAMDQNILDDFISNSETEIIGRTSPIVRRSEVELSVDSDLTESFIEMHFSNHESRSDKIISEEVASPPLGFLNDCTKELNIESVVSKLTSGLLMTVVPEEERLRKQLNDIIQSQNVLIEAIGHENFKFRDAQLLKEVSDIMDRAKVYQVKLTNIKKDMMSLHEKTSQLKRRALKLQQRKQKEALQKEQQRDEELEKEKKLTAKVVLRKS